MLKIYFQFEKNFVCHCGSSVNWCLRGQYLVLSKGSIPCQFIRAFHPLTPNNLKFGTNVPLHELGKCAKLFCARLIVLILRRGGIIFLFCLLIKAALCRRISVFFFVLFFLFCFFLDLKILPYIQYFWNLLCWANKDCRIQISNYFNPISDRKFYFTHPNAGLQNQQLFTYVDYSQSVENTSSSIFIFFPIYACISSPKNFVRV